MTGTRWVLFLVRGKISNLLRDLPREQDNAPKTHMFLSDYLSMREKKNGRHDWSLAKLCGVVSYLACYLVRLSQISSSSPATAALAACDTSFRRSPWWASSAPRRGSSPGCRHPRLCPATGRTETCPPNRLICLVLLVKAMLGWIFFEKLRLCLLVCVSCDLITDHNAFHQPLGVETRVIMTHLHCGQLTQVLALEGKGRVLFKLWVNTWGEQNS